MLYPCEFLEWDSNFFNKRIASINKSNLDNNDLLLIDEWGGQNKIDCIYLLVNSDEFSNIKLFQKQGFEFVDIRLTLQYKTSIIFITPQVTCPSIITIRKFLENDLEELKTFARKNHNNSRFFNDKNFPSDRAADMYAVWIEKCACDHTLLVAQLKDKIVGYLSLQIETHNSGKIVLAGVCSEERNKGIGSQLVYSALKWFREKDVTKITVVTQGANIQAQRLYNSYGFFPVSVQFWFHKWFK